jgi:hypothetical protein
MGEKRNVYRVLVEKPEGKRLLGRQRRRWMDNIKVDLLEIGLDGVNWIGLAQDRVKWTALVSAVMKLKLKLRTMRLFCTCFVSHMITIWRTFVCRKYVFKGFCRFAVSPIPLCFAHFT